MQKKRIIITSTFVLTLVSLIAGALIFDIPRTSAVENQGIGLLPANPREENPRTKSIFVYEASGGTKVQDAVKAVNNTGGSKTVSLYAVDSQASSDGAFACAQAADEKKGVGSWIKLDTERVEIKSFDSVTVPFTVTVPENADPGEHNGCLVLQDTSPSATQNQGGVVLSFRSAIRVAITIPGEIVVKLDLKGITQKTQKDGKLIITPTYENSGNASLDTNIKAELKSVFGTSVSSAGGQFPILPETTSKFNFELKKPVWGGWYKRVVTTSYSRLSSANGDKEEGSLATKTDWVFIAPTTQAMIIELAALALLATATLAFVKNRSDQKDLKMRLTTYKIKDNDNIQSLAKKYKISWRTLAKINKLKAPYTLKTGESIKVPLQSRSNKKG